ncbi:LptA/OstA family protein [Desulfobacula sp.]|uniref:LptA/OstA family protein n=1 Tax=Desulfobacula sp. TaxID=2593537 RepID=UPI0025B93E58|nr:LptA/OstA family protein [Desulfobacula sp.]
MKTSIFCKTALKFLFSLILICFALVLKTNNVYSQTQNEADKAPLHVVSDKMIAQQNASMVEFIGNVKATREDSIVFADSIKIYFVDDSTDKDNSAQSNVKKIVSTGNVRYTAGKQKAFADKAVYTTHDEILVLTGKSPKLITGTNFVTGKKITLFRNQDKVIVESDGTKKRVEAFFNPEDNITDKQ